MDPNPWSWMSGSIREGIGKDGCWEREQFSKIQNDLVTLLSNRSPSSAFSPLLRLRPPCLSFKFFSDNGFIAQEIRGPGSWIKGWSRRCLV